MSRKPCFRVESVPESHIEVVRDITEKGIPLLFRRKLSSVFRIERLGHIETVQPYLVRINLLVPECPFGSTRMGVELFADFPQHAAVFLISRIVIQSVIDTCRTYMVHIVVLLLVCNDLSVIIGHGIRPVSHIVHGIGKVITLRHVQKRKQFQTCGIVPFELALTSVKPGGLGIPEHLGVHHPDGVWFSACGFCSRYLRHQCECRSHACQIFHGLSVLCSFM